MRGEPDAARRTAQLIDLLESERVCARTDDDKTLALAVWTDASVSEPPA
ncbi:MULTISPECIES: hypothetical protein [unclassified Thiocapsa]